MKADRDHFALDSWLRLRDPELRAPHRVRMEDIEVYRVVVLTRELPC